MTVKTEAMLCKGCGATLPFDGTQCAITCEYCGMVNAIQDDGPSGKTADLLRRAKQWEGMKKWDKAKAVYLEIVELDPLNADAWYGAFKSSTRGFTWQIDSLSTLNEFKEYWVGATSAGANSQYLGEMTKYMELLRDRQSRKIVDHNMAPGSVEHRMVELCSDLINQTTQN